MPPEVTPQDRKEAERKAVGTVWHERDKNGNDIVCMHDSQYRALIATSNPPDGHVRTPDGKDVRVLGRFSYTKDGAIALEDSPVYHPESICDGPLYVVEGEVDVPTKRGADNFICQSFRCEVSECFSTKEAARQSISGKGG